MKAHESIQKKLKALMAEQLPRTELGFIGTLTISRDMFYEMDFKSDIGITNHSWLKMTHPHVKLKIERSSNAA